MKFSIITNRIEKETKLKNFDVLENEINNCKDIGDFIILINDTPIEQAVYLQAILKDKNKFNVEIRLESKNDFSQYGIEQITKTDCLDIFRQYFESCLPDLEKWEDITKYVKQYYYNSEIGLNQETVHPSFNDYFKSDFYYSIGDFYSPFGNDSGFDTMMETEKFLQQNDSNNFYLINLIDEININSYKFDEKNDIENLHFLVYDHNKIVAIGFTNLKVNGFIMEDVKQKTLASLNFLNQVQNHKNYEVMISDLIKIEAQTYS